MHFNSICNTKLDNPYMTDSNAYPFVRNSNAVFSVSIHMSLSIYLPILYLSTYPLTYECFYYVSVFNYPLIYLRNLCGEGAGRSEQLQPALKERAEHPTRKACGLETLLLRQGVRSDHYQDQALEMIVGDP